MEGKVWWFEWDTRSNTLSLRAEGDPKTQDSKSPELKAFEVKCTTTLLYCDDDGFSLISYNPFRRTEEHWAHWWSLGFSINDGVYTIQRDDTDFKGKRISENDSRWFHIFRDTEHHETDHHQSTSTYRPLLTGAASLVWALAAFHYNTVSLAKGLPAALQQERGAGTLKVPKGEHMGSMDSHSRADVYRLTLLRSSRVVTKSFNGRNMGRKI